MSIDSQVGAKKDSVSSVVPTILVAEIDERSTVTSQGAIVEGDDAALARLGYKQEFRRAFNPIEVFGLGFSIIGLFPSIASVVVFAIPNGGPVAMVWGWAICSFFLLFVGCALAELGSSAPTSGGLYYWTWTFATPRWRNVLAWVVGYSNSIGLIAGLASIDWGCAVQLMAAVSIGTDTTFVPTTGQTYGVYIALLICHALVSSLATSVVAHLQGIYIALNILLCFAIIIALPAATPNELKNTASFAFGGFSNFNGWPNGFAFVLSFLAPLWTIGGFDAPVHISEEAANARVAVPWGIISAVGIAGILGWAINVAIAFCMGTDLEAIMNSPIGQPMATILFNSFGKKGTLAVWSVVVFVQFLMGSSILTASSRQMFAFARDQGLPLSRYLYRVNSHTHTPINAVWFSAFIALLLGLLAFAGPSANSAIFSLGVTGQYTAFIIPIACRFAGGKKWSPGPFTLGKWGLPVVLVAISWMMFSIIIVAFPTSPMPSAPEMNYMIVVLGGWIVLCLAYYYFPVYGGACWFNGPLANIGEDGNMDAVEDEEKVFKDVQ
ncbi:GABA-specific permease [Grifola frondosa]|uniref:GABA-specific permease n=1 Tax=Grifola frondosa TaxID=5627 RepID=A0A1C7MNN4_GRIFR|nr:GABA-specific permease [Grifola frondosa]